MVVLKVNTNIKSKKRSLKSRSRQEYLKNIQKTLWSGEDIPKIPVEAVTDLASDLFSSSCGARKLAGRHLSEAIHASCKGRVSPCSLVLAMLYLERLNSGGEVALEYLSEVTPVELFVVSMMVANKFLQDEGDTDEVENWFWAEMSGYDLKQLNLLEKEFLAAIQWNVFVSNSDFWRHLHSLHRALSSRQGSRRGWYTYEEASALLQELPLAALLHDLFQVYAACVLSYAAAVVTLVAAAVVTSHMQSVLASLSLLQTPPHCAVQECANAPVLLESPAVWVPVLDTENDTSLLLKYAVESPLPFPNSSMSAEKPQAEPADAWLVPRPVPLTIRGGIVNNIRQELSLFRYYELM